MIEVSTPKWKPLTKAKHPKLDTEVIVILDIGEEMKGFLRIDANDPEKEMLWNFEGAFSYNFKIVKFWRYL